jgi:hypothetical protein
MENPQTFSQFVFFLLFSAVLSILGVPLYLRLVGPNRIYGARSKATLAEPGIWYPVNRITGLWLFLTGLLLAGVASWTYFAGFASYPSACLVGAAFLLGVLVMGFHGNLTLRRLTDTEPTKTAWLIFFLLFVVFIGLLSSGLILGPLR